MEPEHILDTHAESAGQIDAGLGGDDGAFRQRLVVPAVSAGVFVYFQAQAVTEAVAENLTKAPKELIIL